MFLNTYGVSGTLLITSGIMLHGIPVAMLLRNPKYKSIQVPKENNTSLKETLHQHKPDSLDSTEIEILLSSDGPTSQNKELNIYRAEVNNITLNVCRTEANQRDHTANNVTIGKDQPLDDNQQSVLISLSQLPTNKKYIEDDEKHNASSSDCIKQDPTVSGNKQSKYKRALKSFVVLKDPSFLVIMFCQSAQLYVTALVYTTLIEISRDKGIPHSQEHFFLVLLPLAETIGFTCLGWMTDKGYVSAENFMAIGFVFMGLSCCTFTIASNFLIFMIATMGFGISLAGLSSVNPSVIYAFIDEKLHTMAIASRILLFVPFSFTLGLLIGYFRGTLGSYDGALYLLTAICVGCAVLLMLLPYIARCTNRKLQ